MLNADVIDLYIHDCERLLEHPRTPRRPPMGNLRENARRPLTITARVLAVGPDQPAAHDTAFLTVRRRFASKSYEIQLAMARLEECGPAAQYAVAQRSLLVSKCTPGAKDADHTVNSVAALAGCKVRGERK